MMWLALFLMQAGDPGDLARGARVFAQSCAVGYCHGTAGAANRGPRLAGRGLDRAHLEKATREGIPNTAMPGFQKVLSAPDLNAVIAYVASISGGAVAASPAPVHMPDAVPAPFPGPPEARRGKNLFFDATRGTRCGTCHAVEDWGSAVGPNLAAKPPAGAAAIRNAAATQVQTATTSANERFPALVVEQTRDLVRVYDLTSPPPVLRAFSARDLRLAPGAAWSHTSVVSNYKDEELTSIAAYLAWLATRK